MLLQRFAVLELFCTRAWKPREAVHRNVVCLPANTRNEEDEGYRRLERPTRSGGIDVGSTAISPRRDVPEK